MYQSRTGCQWEYLPHDLLRWHAREKKGRKADLSLVVLDTQSAGSAASVPAETTGRDAGKKVPGRKQPEPGLFTQPRPQHGPLASDQDA